MNLYSITVGFAGSGEYVVAPVFPRAGRPRASTQRGAGGLRAGSAGQRMGRVYGEPVEVQLREDGRPAGFTWRGRRYTVTAVQEYWLVNRAWWRESAPVPARPELQFWRVEAAAGPGERLPADLAGEPGDEARSGQASPSTGVYELRGDSAAGTWTLRRIAD
jgi:Domain of unknown function (DUF6504)